MRDLEPLGPASTEACAISAHQDHLRAASGANDPNDRTVAPPEVFEGCLEEGPPGLELALLLPIVGA